MSQQSSSSYREEKDGGNFEPGAGERGSSNNNHQSRTSSGNSSSGNSSNPPPGRTTTRRRDAPNPSSSSTDKDTTTSRPNSGSAAPPTTPSRPRQYPQPQASPGLPRTSAMGGSLTNAARSSREHHHDASGGASGTTRLHQPHGVAAIGPNGSNLSSSANTSTSIAMHYQQSAQAMVSMESPLPPVVQRSLGDRSNEKRKNAALEIEALVKSLQVR